MTGSDIATQARLILKDSTAPYRWADADLLKFLNAGMRETIRRRPDSLYTGTTIVTTTPSDLTSLASTVPLAAFFQQPLVDYVCFQAFLMDSEDPTNAQRAANHLQLFTTGT